MKTLLNIILLLTCIIFALFGIISVFNTTAPIIVIIGVIILVILFKYLNKLLENISNKKSNIIAVLLSILFFIGMVIVGINVTSRPVTDLSHIIEYATKMISTNSLTITGDYFSKYPNQIPLLMIVHTIFKFTNLLGSTNYLLAGTIVNSLFMSLTMYFIYLINKELFNKKSGLLSIIFMFINPIFYMYSSYFYTDTLCMLFAIIGLYLFIKSFKYTNTKKYILLLLSGIIFYIGYKVRVVVLILLIASIIYIILKKKVILKTIIPLVVGLLLGMIIFNVWENYYDIDLDKDKEFPLTHWVMMGLNKEHDGGYNSVDHNITYNAETYQEKIDTNIDEIFERLSNLGVIGTLKLVGAKNIRTWTDGTYGVFAKLTNSSNTSTLYKYIGGYGENNSIVKCYLQMLKVFICLVMAYGAYKLFKRKDKTTDTIIYIALFGAVIFYTIWEATARYSLSFLPWMIILVGNEAQEFKPNISKNIKHYGSMIFIFLVIILLGIGYYQCSIKENTYTDPIVVSYRGSDKININDSTITQTFNTDQVFNQVKIKFKNTDITINSIYSFSLYEDNILINTQTFNSNDIDNNSFYTFVFDSVSPSNMTEYKILIEKLEGDSTLSIVTYNESFYYNLLDTTTTIDDEQVSNTFVFQVSYNNKRTYINKYTYIIFSIILLSMLIICLKDNIKKNFVNI